MAVTATGYFGKAAEAMLDLIAGSDTFIGEQPNLVTNGTFETADVWTFEDGGLPNPGWWYDSINNRALFLVAGTNKRVYQTVSIIAGQIYQVEYTAAITGGSINGLLGGTNFAVSDGTGNTVNVVAGSTDSIVAFNATDNDPPNIYIDDVSLYHLPIYIGEYNPGAGNALADCFAVIETNRTSSRHTGTGAYLNNGSLDIIFERAIPEAYQAEKYEPDAIMDFWNYLDAVIDECQTLSNSAGYLLTRNWDIAAGPQRIEKENRLFARVSVGWGLSD